MQSTSRLNQLLVNGHQNQTGIDAFAKSIKTTQISTPTLRNEANNNDSTMPFSMLQLEQVLDEVLSENLADQFQAKLNEWENRIVERCEQKIFEHENDIKFLQYDYHNKGFTGGFNLTELLRDEMQRQQRAMAVMLQQDEHAIEYFRMKAENEELKQMLRDRNQSRSSR